MNEQRRTGSADSTAGSRHVGFFVTCLVDLFRPSVGFAAIALLEKAGCRVAVPNAQVCCGQPAYNAGDRRDAQAIARNVIAAFETFPYVVAPSGSCTGMIREHYPKLFAEDPDMRGRAEDLAGRTWELMSFLVDVLGVTDTDAPAFPRKVTYHDSCSGYRELGIKAQPRLLLAGVPEMELAEISQPEVCCGFGGTFCVKYPDISNKMVTDKAEDIAGTGAGTVLGGDLGCLLNIAGKLKRMGATVEARHVAEVLAGMADRPGIGDSEG
ncbi:MAG: (Fe-S)-binding protein [Alphaproteobacteria bacterium]|jgi:L-lactate dehydrogenase complex protein LldE|nr:(Fe-S)-binding protein [Alphaproteobacteria bacterium]